MSTFKAFAFFIFIGCFSFNTSSHAGIFDWFGGKTDPEVECVQNLFLEIKRGQSQVAAMYNEPVAKKDVISSVIRVFDKTLSNYRSLSVENCPHKAKFLVEDVISTTESLLDQLNKLDKRWFNIVTPGEERRLHREGEMFATKRDALNDYIKDYLENNRIRHAR